MQLERLYRLAEGAKKDKSLLPNHKPFVPEELNKHRSELLELVEVLKDDAENRDTYNKFISEIKKIDNALLSYQKEKGGGNQ